MNTVREEIAAERASRAKIKQPKLIRMPKANLVAMHIRDTTLSACSPYSSVRPSKPINPLFGMALFAVPFVALILAAAK